MNDKDLPITIRASPNANSWDRQTLGHLLSEIKRHPFQDNSKRACLFHGLGVF